jgi:hypothetical protein
LSGASANWLDRRPAFGDAVHYMVIARSLAFDGDVDLGNDYGDPTNIIKEPAGTHARIGLNGVLRPIHDIGLPLIGAPLFRVAYSVAKLTDRLPASLRRSSRLSSAVRLPQLCRRGKV